MIQLTEQDPKFWGPEPQTRDWLLSQIPDGARVLDMGPGRSPFLRADVFVDYNAEFLPPDKPHHLCDLSIGVLPFESKSFDFIYCRHVLEDMACPFALCDEMSRVGKRGYIETPSPLAEFCRGVDGGSPHWRGYHHHRYLVWDKDGELRFVSKFPIIEYAWSENEEYFVDALRGSSLYWNTRYLWEGSIRWRHMQCPMDFDITTTYPQVIAEAIRESAQANVRFLTALKEDIPDGS